jgi:hypothetical protein
MESNKSIRLRTTPGLSQNIQVKIDQDFDTIDFLSLKITQEDAYRNFCSDYGVVAGRVIANDGFGVENAKISIFIPLLDEDSERDEILSIYPYSSPSEVNAQGIRYNLLPKNGKRFYFYQKIPVGQTPQNYLGGQYNSVTPLGTFIGSWENATSLGLVPEETPGYNTWRRLVDATHGPRIPIGTLPSKTEILDNDTLLEVYDKYYKLSTRSNSSGDYMIFGVPTGTKIVHMDVDLSDAGQSSLTVDDFINLGFPQNLFDGDNFKSATNLDSLPQIETRDISVDVIPFWGNLDECEIGITRLDFNLNKVIQPSAYLIGYSFTNRQGWFKPNGGIENGDFGNNFGPIGSMIPLNVNVYSKAVNADITKTESFSNGPFLTAVPMYSERLITDEFGNLTPSPDGIKGIPTSGEYEFYVWNPTSHASVEENAGENKTAYHSTVRTILRYDILNKKRLIYTLGQENKGQDCDTCDARKWSILGNDKSPDSSVETYPSSYRAFGSDRFGEWEVCYGSLYMPKFEVKDGNNAVYGYVVNYQPSSIGEPYEGYRYNNSCYLMDVTDIVGLGLVTSAKIGYTGGQQIDGLGEGGNESDLNVANETLPLKNNTNNGNAIWPLAINRLNTVDTSLSLIRRRSLYDNNTNYVTLNSKKSEAGRYFMYFGLHANNNALTYLKEKLGE